MALKDAAPPVDGKGIFSWSEAEKIQLLYNMILAFRQEGQTIPWNRVTLPGRTIKSCMHMWAKINNKMSDHNEDVQKRAGAPITPPKTPCRRGRPAKRKASVLEDSKEQMKQGIASLEDGSLEDEIKFEEIFESRTY